MIVEALCNLVSGLVKILFSWVNLPAMPEGAQTAFDTYFGLIFDNLDFLSFFVNISTLKIVAAVAIGLFTFEHMYKLVIWIIHKIPISTD